MVITCLIVLVVTDAFCLCGPCYRITRSCSGDRILLGAGSYGKVYWGVLAWRDLPERRAWEKWVAVKESGVEGKRGDIGGGRIIKKKKTI